MPNDASESSIASEIASILGVGKPSSSPEFSPVQLPREFEEWDQRLEQSFRKRAMERQKEFAQTVQQSKELLLRVDASLRKQLKRRDLSPEHRSEIKALLFRFKEPAIQAKELKKITPIDEQVKFLKKMELEPVQQRKLFAALSEQGSAQLQEALTDAPQDQGPPLSHAVQPGAEPSGAEPRHAIPRVSTYLSRS